MILNMDYLSVKQVAELKGCTERFVRKQISDGKIIAHEHISPANNLKQYLIPVDTLPDELKKRYLSKLKVSLAPPKEDRPKPIKRSFDQLADSERREIRLWTQIIEDWLRYRAEFKTDGKNKTEADPLYIAKVKLEYKGINISTDILYKKYRAYRENDFEGLLDKRGGWNKGRSSIPDQVWDYFLLAYLDDRRLPISRCYDLCIQWTKEFYPELVSSLPAEISFRRRAQQIEKAVVTLGREGDKAFNDRCAPYITRLYDDLHANAYWVADNHTLDIVSQKDGKKTTHRLSLTAFIDAYSGVMVGWNLTDNPCSQSTVLALRHAILRFGLPDVVYFDNGSEFLTHDIAGRGHRTRKSQDLITDPPPIFKRLDIEMRNALVRNAKAKPIERTFGTFKNQISRLFETFCGGDISERPESLKYKLKNGIVPLDSQLNVLIADLIDGEYNMGLYGGKQAQYKGKTRLDVWNESIQTVVQRKATEEDLNLLLMRTSRPQKVQRNGVYINILGEKLWYYDADTWKLLGKEVYVRYDPAALAKVLVYDAATDKRICQLPMATNTMLLFNDTPENIKIAQSDVRRVKKDIRAQVNGIKNALPPEQRLSVLDLAIRKAHAAKEGMIIQSSKVIQPVVVGEEPLKSAVGAEITQIPIDITKMNRNAGNRKNNKY